MQDEETAAEAMVVGEIVRDVTEEEVDSPRGTRHLKSRAPMVPRLKKRAPMLEH